MGSSKMAWNEQLCAHQKSYSKYIFQYIFGAVAHVRDCSCAPILQFSLQRQMVPQQNAKFRTAGFRQFCSSLRRDSVANYASISTQFPASARGLEVLENT